MWVDDRKIALAAPHPPFLTNLRARLSICCHPPYPTMSTNTYRELPSIGVEDSASYSRPVKNNRYGTSSVWCPPSAVHDNNIWFTALHSSCTLRHYRYGECGVSAAITKSWDALLPAECVSFTCLLHFETLRLLRMSTLLPFLQPLFRFATLSFHCAASFCKSHKHGFTAGG